MCAWFLFQESQCGGELGQLQNNFSRQVGRMITIQPQLGGWCRHCRHYNLQDEPICRMIFPRSRILERGFGNLSGSFARRFIVGHRTRMEWHFAEDGYTQSLESKCCLFFHAIYLCHACTPATTVFYGYFQTPMQPPRVSNPTQSSNIGSQNPTITWGESICHIGSIHFTIPSPPSTLICWSPRISNR